MTTHRRQSTFSYDLSTLNTEMLTEERDMETRRSRIAKPPLTYIVTGENYYNIPVGEKILLTLRQGYDAHVYDIHLGDMFIGWGTLHIIEDWSRPTKRKRRRVLP